MTFRNIGLGASAALLLACGAFAAYQASVQQRILPRVAIDGQPVGGMDLAEARQTAQQATHDLSAEPVTVVFEDRTWSATAAELGLGYDLESAIKNAFAIGHDGPPWAGLTAQLALLRQPANVELRLTATDKRLADWIAAIARDVDRPLQEASLQANGSAVSILTGQDGRRVEQADLQAAVMNAVLASSSEPIDLPLLLQPQTRTADQLATAAAELRAALDPKPLVLTQANRTWSVSPALWQTSLQWSLQPAPSAGLQLSFDESPMRDLVQGIARQANHGPQDAQLGWGDSGLTVVKPSVDGVEVDVDATLSAIKKAIRAGDKSVLLAVNLALARISDHNLAALGLKELVAAGTSNFSYSPWARVVNVKKMASLLNGTLIAPGEEFSFNKVMGDIDPRLGWAEGLVISGGRTVPGLGGGICQVSTTTFRGAFLAGLPITERHDHEYPVPYYTQDGSPEGFDATVWSPDLDLKFVNDTPGYLLIQTRLDMSSDDLAVNFYGTKVPGRTVKMQEPRISGIRPAPAPRHITDPKKPKDYVEQTDWPHSGMHVVLKRDISDASGTRTDEFVSDYTPWSAVFIEGPKDEPPPAPGAPPTPGASPAPGTSPAPATAPAPSPTPASAH